MVQILLRKDTKSLSEIELDALVDFCDLYEFELHK